EHVRADLVPGQRRRAPALLQLEQPAALVAQQAQLAALDVAADLRRLDLPQLFEEHLELVRALRPVSEPGVFELLATIDVGRVARIVERRRRRAARLVLAARGVPCRVGPEPVPAP